LLRPLQRLSSASCPSIRISLLPLHDALPISFFSPSLTLVSLTTNGILFPPPPPEPSPAAIDTRLVEIIDKHISIGKNIFLNILRSEEHTSELQSRFDLVCRLLLEKKKSIFEI